MLIPQQRHLLPTLIACLLTSILLLVFTTKIHSDILFMRFLLDDIFLNGGSWSDWKMSPAPSYFPDMIIYLASYLLSKNIVFEIIFVTFVQIGAIGTLCVWLTKRLLPNSSRAVQYIPLLALLLTVVTSDHFTGSDLTGKTNIAIYFISNNIQVPTLISGLILLGLAITFLTKQKITTAFLFLIIAAIAQASSAVFLICFTLPFFLTLIALIAHATINKNRTLTKTLTKLTILLGTSQIAGYYITNAITFNSPLQGRIYPTLQRAEISLDYLISGLQNLLNPTTPWVVISFIFFATTVTYALFKSITLACKTFTTVNHTSNLPNLTETSQFLICVFFLTTTATSILGSIISGGFADVSGFRYFMTFIALSIPVSLLFIDKKERLSKYKHTPITLTILALALTIPSAIFVILKNKDTEINDTIRYGAFYDDSRDIASCIQNSELSGIRLTSGIANYIDSRATMYYLNRSHYILSSDNNLDPSFWITTQGPVATPLKYGITNYNFIVAQDNEIGLISGFDIKNLTNKIPKNYKKLACNDSGTSLLIFEGDTLDKALRTRQQNALFKNYGRGSALYNGSDLPGLIGTVSSNSKIVTPPEKAGILSYGPYLSLPHGNYKLTLNTTSSDSASLIVGKIEVGDFASKQPTILYSGEIQSSDRDKSIRFTTPENGIEQLEVHITYNGSGSLELRSINFERL
ncbi:hypothetical protein J3D54_000003 [Pseudomonas sp. GGS8]|uniref:hypothetical protein n=1 Tax=Pseudomonas sp. GGS8 TaxID=2817892 RepID=UPI0020A1669B|nr:hypothetical protein [Pseudomonas sp. GGS8]MCP1440871.1 hypothetical protein [Pseudomonas sp. GGS8]